MKCCKTYEKYMYDKLDGTIESLHLKELDAHLEVCEDCKNEFQFISLISSKLQNEEMVPLPAKFDVDLRKKLLEINMNKKESIFVRFPYINRIATAVAAIGIMIFAYQNVGYAPYGINEEIIEPTPTTQVIAVEPTKVPQTEILDGEKQNKTPKETTTVMPSKKPNVPKKQSETSESINNDKLSNQNVIDQSSNKPVATEKPQHQDEPANQQSDVATNANSDENQSQSNVFVIRNTKQSYSYEIKVTLNDEKSLKDKISKIATYNEVSENYLEIENEYYKDVKKAIEETQKKSATYLTKDEEAEKFVVIIIKEN